MATLKVRKFRDALKRAKNVGRVEESVTIDGCHVVLQSLTSDMHEAIFAELDGEVHVYNMGYQVAMLSHSIVEIEGVDLRNFDVIEDEAPAKHFILNALVANEHKAVELKKALAEQGVDVSLVPVETAEDKTYLLEKAEWVKRHLETWSREAVLTGYKKCLDVIAKGEIQSSQDVKFTFTGETDEEKYRRLLAELKALEDTLPSELVANVLNDAGYLQKNSTREMEEVISKLEVEVPDLAPPPPQPPIQEKPSLVVPRAEPVAPIPIPTQIPPEVSKRMVDRTPMNQPSLVPNQLRQQPPVEMPAQGSEDDISTLEAIKRGAVRYQETLSSPVPKFDEAAAASIIDQPQFGLNPKFHRRQQ